MRKIYVYIPGFEYDSKGPLHIDAIELNAWAAEGDSEESQKLKTYIYIGKNLPSIEGSIIYRCVYSNSDYVGGNNFSWIKNRYDDSVISDKVKEPFASSYACIHRNSAAAPIMINRAMTGSYYDFVTISGEITHHIIGMYDTVSYCKEITNLNSEQHDGLFAIEVENLNTDIILKFNLYSRVNTSEDGISSEVGIKEDISTVRENINNKNNVIDTTQYIKVGEFTKTYNPAISGNKIDLKNVTFLSIDVEPKQLYFDWQLGNNDWQIPVNAGLLVTDKSLIGGHYKLLKYDKALKLFTTASLACDSFSNRDFYLKFYKDTQKSFSLVEDLIRSEKRGNTIFGCRKAGYVFYDHWQRSTAFIISSQQINNTSFEYKLCKADLAALSYLYNHTPSVKVTNDLENKIAITIDSWGRNIINNDQQNPTWPSLDQKVMADYSILDCQHLREKSINSELWLNYYYLSDDIKDTTINNNGPASIFLLCELAISDTKSRVLDEVLDLNYIDLFLPYYSDILDQQIYAYNTNRLLPSGDKISYHAYDQDSHEEREILKSLYIKKIKKTEGNIPSSLLSSTEVNLSETNKIGLYFKCASLLFPAMAYGQKAPSGGNISVIHNTYNSGVTFDEVKQSLLKRGIGTVSIFIPQTFYIDINNSNISFSNAADYKVVPTLKVLSDTYNLGYIKNGWQQTNIEETNLLVVGSNAFEIANVVNDQSVLKTPQEINYKTGKKYYSSFCNDKRFITLLNSAINPIIINKTKIGDESISSDLLTSLYVLKVSTGKYTNSNILISYTIKDVNDQIVETNSIGSSNKLWAFCLKHREKLIINSIKSTKTLDFDYIGGIGLYKVNLEQTDTNTLALKSAVKLITQSCLIPFDNVAIYESIIFPSVFCAKENIEFCKRRSDSPYRNAQVNSGKDYNPDYDNDYCSSVSDDPIYHYYNFKYLPIEAIYDVEGFYEIPGGNTTTIDLNKLELFGDLTQEQVAALGTINVKTS